MEKVVLRLPNWVGDAVMASGVIPQLHQIWPETQLHLWGPASIVELFRHDPQVAAIHPWRAKGWRKYAPSSLRALAREQFQRGVLLTRSFSSAWQLAMIGVPWRGGFRSDARSWLLTHTCPWPRRLQHQVVTYQQLLEQLTGCCVPIYPPRLYLDPTSAAWAEQWCDQHLPRSRYKVVGVNPSAAYGPAKQWPAERFKELVKRLVRHSIAVLVFGDDSSTLLGQQIVEGLESSGYCFNLVGRTSMSRFTALMARCDGVIANDSGPMHIAAALGLPLVALFGSTDQRLTGPYSCRARVVDKQPECAPCFRRICPTDFRCMKGISVKEVEQTLLEQLLIGQSRVDTQVK